MASLHDSTFSLFETMPACDGRTDEQADRQTRRQHIPASIASCSKKPKIFVARAAVSSEPHQTWHGDIGHQASFCTSKTFWGTENLK